MSHVTNRQMVFLIVMTLTTYYIISIPYEMARTAGRGGWIPVLIASVIFAFLSLPITKLNNMYPGKMLFDYSRDIAGKFFSYAISIYFILYFLLIFTFLDTQIFDLVKAEFLPKTPTWSTAFAGITVFGFIAYKGITNIARLFEIIAPIFIALAIIVFLMALFQGIKYNVLPVFESDRIVDYISALPKACVSFLGIELLLIIPFTKQNKKAPKIVFFALLLIGLFYILVVESSMSIVGINTLMHYEASVIEALKLVEVPFFERVDIWYQTFGFCGLFLGMTIIYTVIAELLCKLIPKAKRWIIVLITGIVLFVSRSLLELIQDVDKILPNIIFITGIISVLLIPDILFIIAKVKKRAEKSV